MSAENLEQRYEFVRVHSKGGMGSVSVVRDSILQREVALKTINSRHNSNDKMRNLFVREAQITGNLQHPNIVPVYEMSSSDPERAPFYTMRLVRGETLATHIKNYHAGRQKQGAKRTEFYRLLQTMVSISQTIAFAHSRGVIHLDLKPSNVVLGEFGEVVVLDWGLAEALSGTQLNDATSADHEGGQKRLILGTPVYMSPEQATGQSENIGPQTDVYGLGAILYELLTGEPPHPLKGDTNTSAEAPTLTQFPQDLQRDETLHALTTNKWVPPRLKAVCLHALSKTPESRYPKVTNLVEDLQHWLADEPVSVYKSMWYEHFILWIRRHRTLAAVSGCLFLFLLVFMANLFRLTLLDRQDQLTNALAQEITSSKEALRAMGNYMRTEGIVAHPQFREFVRPYHENSEELLALEWIPRVEAAKRAELEASGAKSIHPNFEIREFGAGGELIRAGQRNIYYPVLYAEPLERNLKALGFDLGSSENRLEAIQTALTQGRPTVSCPVELVQSTEQKPGMLTFFPVFSDTENPPKPNREALGLVLGVYEIHGLIEKAWKNVSTKHLTVEVYDITHAESPVFLWGNDPGPPKLQQASLTGGARLPLIHRTCGEVSVLNHTWKVCIQARSRFLLYYPTSR